ncbi:39S ribosomal L10, mitochondrial [Pelobates cultripes]|uniref:Large ribosomal subunit protein uL10m n=1 Tax=Pelobates cultripes TaxID=61616 RepID=A0AAD1SJJ9_PELCU|nr:39S ribosomal L10, mitochondrial [Pelobates cultripes]
MHFERQKLMAVTEYISPKPAVQEECLTPRTKATEKEEDNPLKRLLVSQMNTVLQECKMVAVFQRNSIGSEELLLLRHKLLKHGIHIKHFPNKVVKTSLAQFHLQSMQQLFLGQTFLLVSHDVKVKEMLQSVRNVPQIVLLGKCQCRVYYYKPWQIHNIWILTDKRNRGIILFFFFFHLSSGACIESRLLSRQGVQAYAKLPTLEYLQSQVVGTLTLMASQTSSLLTQHSTLLCAQLEQHIKEQSGGSKNS